MELKPNVYIPFSILPEGRKWTIGKTYRVRLVLKQRSIDETGASFEVEDAMSLEHKDKGERYFLAEGGKIKG